MFKYWIAHFSIFHNLIRKNFRAAIIIFAHSSHRRRPLTYHIYVENNYAEFEGIQQYHTLYNYSIITYNKYNS